MNWSKWIRQTHRWVSIVFTVAVIINGVTVVQGKYNNRLGPSRCGTIFKIDPSGKKTALYVFTDGSDGANPFAELVMDETTHTLYGTAYRGGDQNCSTPYGGGKGCGVVFKIEY